MTTNRDVMEADFGEDEQEHVDPIKDIIDYLVRSAKISFKNSRVNEEEIRTNDKIRMAHDLYQQSPPEFLTRFGKYLAPNHIGYFENVLERDSHNHALRECIQALRTYHSDLNRHKRVRNRRFKALQHLQNETDYFSEKQMMLRSPLPYEQLVGQYLTGEEIRERDNIDNENLTLLNLILDTVDRNQMSDTKNKQMLEEGLESVDINCKAEVSKTKRWGEFDTDDTKPSHKPEVRKQCMISGPERRLLREEFNQEMYSSFLDGYDDFDYSTVDDNEQYDDLQQASQDEEDKYFDSETNEVENLEEHLHLVQEYGRRNSNMSNGDDPLDEFMKHLSQKLET